LAVAGSGLALFSGADITWRFLAFLLFAGKQTVNFIFAKNALLATLKLEN
jgi:hypothetical protein